ncbi:MAG: cytochrome c biogenesis protein CcdA [Bacillota bacterium]
MELNVVIAFLAGVVSFLSPCVIALAPGYIGFVAGIGAGSVAGAARGDAVGGRDPGRRASAAHRARVLLATTLFVLGFSSVFVAVGAGASLAGELLYSARWLLDKLAGLIVIVFGLHVAGAIHVRWLYSERRVFSAERPAGLAGGFLVGAAFALGWTPCVGPILGSILAVAGTSGRMGQGVILLAAYSLGLGLPFLAMGFAIGRGVTSFPWLTRHGRTVEVLSGLFLVAVGLLMFSGKTDVISSRLGSFFGDFMPDRLLGF